MVSVKMRSGSATVRRSSAVAHVCRDKCGDAKQSVGLVGVLEQWQATCRRHPSASFLPTPTTVHLDACHHLQRHAYAMPNRLIMLIALPSQWYHTGWRYPRFAIGG